MFLVGLLATGVLGGSVGLWFFLLVDWVRCHALGVPDAREAEVCPLLFRSASLLRIPWEQLQARAPHRTYAYGALFSGALLWMLAWVLFFMRDSSIFGWVWNTVFVSGLLFVSLLDIRWRMLPVEPLFAAALLLGLGRIFLGASLVSVLLGAVVLGVFFGLQSWLSRGRWLGAGDPALAVAIGAALGWPAALMAVYATYMAVIPLLLFQYLRVRQWRGFIWPFAPLLSVGALTAWIWGAPLWRWFSGG